MPARSRPGALLSTTSNSVKFNAVASQVTRQLVISNLHFKYNLCVDPNSVSFGVYPTNDFGFCDTDTSLNSAVSTSRTEKAVENGTQTTDLTLKIDADDLNANKLGKAYSLSNDESSISLCVRARVKKGDVEVLFTEHNIKATFRKETEFEMSSHHNHSSNGNNPEIQEYDMMSTAYQCNKQYEKIKSPLSPQSNILRVCIEGESDAFKCKNIVSATLKQKGIEDNQLITDGKSSGEFTMQSSKDQICMLTTLIVSKYFVKKSNDDKVCT